MLDFADVLKAIALVMLLEGVAYALFPDAMRNAMRQMLSLPNEALRLMGMIAVTLAVCVLWLMGNYLGGS
ncbi:MAG: DUF2065 domain-containing protein [Alphaproteobacteria bacterium]|nr:DUF2065 domain-containing protein [Alphaproteobacteria bacterium SS10]